MRLGAVLLLVMSTACRPSPIRWSNRAGHAALACADCHAGRLAEAGRASVPDQTCVRSACHEKDLDEEVRLGVVSLSHERHGGEATDLECSACHSHDPGASELTARIGTCTVCHLEEMSGARERGCHTCHGLPEEEVETSQGVAFSHETPPWIEDRCTRCHYDVAPPSNAVRQERCLTCHDSRPEDGSDLHAGHRGFTCTACHERQTHRIIRMSSAVDLVCTDCHARPHDVGTPWQGEERVCDGCHEGTHADQQRMVLGLVAEDVTAVPSEKFLLGLTCRSCHARAPSRSSQGDGPEVACTICHTEEYAAVLQWWEDGIRQRVQSARAFTRSVEQLADNDDGGDLARATALLDFIENGRGVHNLVLTHHLLQRSVGLTSAVNATLGSLGPPPPSLGLAPDANACSRCHYNLRFDPSHPGGPMRDRFHREVTSQR